MTLSNYAYLGLTKSLCPTCMSLVDAKIISRGTRVYFLKECKECGPREDFVCSDVKYYDRLQYSVPGKIPKQRFAPIKDGCPYDCGLCESHEQHTCVALVELTDSCNLSCPMCFASSLPGNQHRSMEEIKKAIDRIVEAEGQPEVVQLSGGEPTIHPDFVDVVKYAIEQPIDYLTVNTNGLRFAKDRNLLEQLSPYRDRLEVFLQFDGFEDDHYRKLRGEALLAQKLRAVDLLGEYGLNITLAVTLQGGVNEDQIVPIVKFAQQHRHITAINFQPATYSGRYTIPEDLERRVTFPDVIKSIANGLAGQFREEDFMPLPCAHPNCHSLTVAYRHQDQLIPVSRFFDFESNYDLLANGIAFTRNKSRQLITQYLTRLSRSSCDQECVAPESLPPTAQGPNRDFEEVAAEFYARAMRQDLGAQDLLRITITSFLDAFNFDLRRLMKCCTHHVLPSGHIIPFCAYNVLYREGHVDLPDLTQSDPVVQEIKRS